MILIWSLCTQIACYSVLVTPTWQDICHASFSEDKVIVTCKDKTTVGDFIYSNSIVESIILKDWNDDYIGFIQIELK